MLKRFLDSILRNPGYVAALTVVLFVFFEVVPKSYRDEVMSPIVEPLGELKSPAKSARRGLQKLFSEKLDDMTCEKLAHIINEEQLKEKRQIYFLSGEPLQRVMLREYVRKKYFKQFAISYKEKQKIKEILGSEGEKYAVIYKDSDNLICLGSLRKSERDARKNGDTVPQIARYKAYLYKGKIQAVVGNIYTAPETNAGK